MTVSGIDECRRRLSRNKCVGMAVAVGVTVRYGTARNNDEAVAGCVCQPVLAMAPVVRSTGDQTLLCTYRSEDPLVFCNDNHGILSSLSLSPSPLGFGITE